METMYDRIVKMCKARGMTPSGLCVRLGIRKAIMSDLKSGRTESIRTGTLCMFAGALGVTTDYLLLGKETNLTEKESRLLAAYKQATDTERETIDFILRKYTP